MNQTAATPTQTPPRTTIGAGGDAAGSSLAEPTLTDAIAAGATQKTPQSPTDQPPTSTSSAAGAGLTGTASANGGTMTGTWHNDITVDALWAADQARNAWMRVVGIGWKKLYNGGDGSFTALATIASQARQTGRPLNYREEADGMVDEIYLW